MEDNYNETMLNPSDVIHSYFELAEQGTEAATDISGDMTRFEAVLPTEEYLEKGKLIREAQDLSTQEKIEALNAAEDKRIRDFAEAEEVQHRAKWVKAGIFLALYLGILVINPSFDLAGNLRKISGT